MAIVTVKKLENGDLFLEIPQVMLDELGWSDGMEVEWVENQDGSWTLKKNDK